MLKEKLVVDAPILEKMPKLKKTIKNRTFIKKVFLQKKKKKMLTKKMYWTPKQNTK